MLAKLIQRFTGTYVQTGAFSFEYRSSDGKKIAEYLFLLPPESYRCVDSQRGSIDKTISGGYWADFGNEFKEISLAGSLHFYYNSNSHREPGLAAADSSSDGLMEFIKMKFMLSRYRDFTLTRSGRLVAPSFSGKAFADANALKKKAIKKQGYNEDVDVIFHAYDFDDHFYVRVEKFEYNLDKSDPNTVNYNIQLTGIEQYESGKLRKAYKKKIKKLKPKEQITQVNEISGNLHESSIPSGVTISGPVGASTAQIPNQVQNSATVTTNITALDPSSAENVLAALISQIETANVPLALKDLELFQINDKLKTLRAQFQNSISKVLTNAAGMQQEFGTVIADIKKTIADLKNRLEIIHYLGRIRPWHFV